ncbi:MAG: hypothetical protein DHS20C21_05400 [Gemmatimonadota bacterium]|nr:MAG: hypothetical protein DHS20C21_05400 [Gemmatimonadota bacterium]
MRNWLESLAVTLGKEPTKPAPDRFTAAVCEIHKERQTRRAKEETFKIIEDRKEKVAAPQKWRRRRWAVLIAVNLLFVLSFRLDLQFLEGTLSASRFMGFHMADIFSALQVMLASKLVLVNLVIGTATVAFLCLGGGRTFCGWICPYHLLSEWAESLHLMLAKRKIARNLKFDRRARVVIWIVFSVLAFGTGYTVYETISPTGILSRALVYGPGMVLVWVACLLAFEVLFSRRAWCRYACPIGLTYAVVGSAAPLRIVYKIGHCHHDGACREVCLVPHVLDLTKRGRAPDVQVDVGGDCTRCARCLDVCPTGALSLQVKGLGNRD